MLFILIAAFTSVGTTQDSAIDSLFVKADSLYDHFYEAEALELYTSILNLQPDNYRALWRASFLYSRIGYRFDSKERKRSYFDKGISLARRALEVDSMDTKSNFVMAVALGRKAMISGAKERVSASRSIKQYAKRAIRLDSTNAGAWHVLGRLHFKLANLNFVEKVAANTIFGGVPKASKTKAVHFIEKAINLAPTHILYYYDLARMYKDLGKEQQAVVTCKQALQLEPLSPDDPIWQDKCRNLIKDLQ